MTRPPGASPSRCRQDDADFVISTRGVLDDDAVAQRAELRRRRWPTCNPPLTAASGRRWPVVTGSAGRCSGRPWFLCPSASPGSAIRAVVPWRGPSQGGRQGRRGASRWFSTLALRVPRNYRSRRGLSTVHPIAAARAGSRARPRACRCGALSGSQPGGPVRLSQLAVGPRPGHASSPIELPMDTRPIRPACDRKCGGGRVNAALLSLGERPMRPSSRGPLSVHGPASRRCGRQAARRRRVARTPEGWRRSDGQRDGQRGSRARTSRVGIASAYRAPPPPPPRPRVQPARRARHGGGSLAHRGVPARQ